MRITPDIDPRKRPIRALLKSTTQKRATRLGHKEKKGDSNWATPKDAKRPTIAIPLLSFME
jgi:hypothetical protein